MKPTTLLNGGYRLTTLTLMLLTITACENDDFQPADTDIIANAGKDINVLTGETARLQAISTSNPSGITYAWRFISIPENSQASLIDFDKSNPSFQADLQGKYKLELTLSTDQQTDSDTVTVAAFTVNELQGSYDIVFGISADDAITKLLVFNDKLYAAGIFRNIGNVMAQGIAVFDGTNWSPLGSGFFSLEDFVSDMIVYQDELYVAGFFKYIGGVLSPGVARWDGTNWKAVGKKFGNDGYGVNSLAVFQDELYIGGQPYSNGIGGCCDHNVALTKWDGNELVEVQSGLSTVNELEVYKNTLYAGGYSDPNANFASFDGSQWEILGPIENENIASGAMTIQRMAVYQDLLFISGEFFDEQNNGSDIGSELITWDGSQFQDYGKAFSLTSFAGNEYVNRIYTLEVINNTLYIGGGSTGCWEPKLRMAFSCGMAPNGGFRVMAIIRVRVITAMLRQLFMILQYSIIKYTTQEFGDLGGVGFMVFAVLVIRQSHSNFLE